jgi:hypothetical protein
MVCRFNISEESHSTVRNTEPCSKRQVQWKLRKWETCEQRCARHHAVCWWPSGQDGYMQCELAVACCIVSCLLFTTDSLDKNAFELTNETEDITYQRFQLLLLFGFYDTLWDLQVPTFCRNILPLLQGDWIWFR